MNKIDNILDSLKGRQPVIADEDDFADFVMEGISADTPSAAKNNPIVIAMRAITSIAAALIIGLFIYQSAEEPDVMTPSADIYKNTKSSGSTIRNVHSHCINHSNTLSINQLKAKYHEKF